MFNNYLSIDWIAYSVFSGIEESIIYVYENWIVGLLVLILKNIILLRLHLKRVFLLHLMIPDLLIWFNNVNATLLLVRIFIFMFIDFCNFYFDLWF
jgi:hypothetical protein